MATILITGARAPVALELARSFYAKGHRVLMADSMHWPLGRWSSAVERYYKLPSPARDFNAFSSIIQSIVLKEKVHHLIPTCEETFHIGRISNLPTSCFVWTSEIALLDSLHHKLNFTKLASAFFEVPATIRCDAFDDWKNTSNYVFKPIYSRFASSTIIAKPESFCAKPKENPKQWIAQEYIEGKELSVYSIWRQGKLKAYSCYHSPYRAGKGAGIFFETVYHEPTFDAVKKIGESIGFTGQLCFDIILKEDKPYVLECNPRATSGAHILNAKLADIFLKEEQVIVKAAPVFMIRVLVLFAYPKLLFAKKFYRGMDVLFRANDLKPTFLQMLSVIEFLYIKLKYNLTFLQATTEDIEWNGNDDQVG